MLELRLLGQFSVRLDGAAVRIPSRPAQSLLAYLAMTTGITHRREMLAGLFWPQATEADARRYLRQALWRIRRAIEPDERSDQTYLLSDDINIAFNATADCWVDVTVLRRMESDAGSTAELIDGASLYQGELLPGFYDDWIMAERENLQATFDRVMHRLLDRLVGRERWYEAREWAEHWIAHSGAPEPAYRALMVAGSALDDHSAVALAFQRCVDALRRELDVEPSEETRELHARLVETAGLARSVRVRLPAQPTPLVGREQELVSVARCLADPSCRLLTLTGPAGIGKTRLALQAAANQADAFEHGVFFVPVGPVASPEFLPPTVANALGFTFYGSASPHEQLLDHLRDRELLLVLDGFEHLLGGVAFVAQILEDAPRVRLIVTSRERLNIRGEWLFEVTGLQVPQGEDPTAIEGCSAGRLFLQCARSHHLGFTLSTEDAPHLAHLCRLTGGLPLAIELAAAWVRVLSCADVAGGIERNLDFLATSRRDVPPRHRSLLAAFEHSWNLLSEEEQRVFRCLGVFQGGFDREAAAQVAGASLPVLSMLVDKSLILRSSDGRFDLHELLRRYALAKLREADEAEAIRKRHYDWFLTLAEQAEPMLWGAGEAAWLDRLETEQGNLRAALAWSVQRGDPEARMRLTAALSWFWYVRSRFSEGRRWLDQALAERRDVSALTLSRALNPASILAAQQGDYEQAEKLSAEALALLRDLDAPWMQGWALTVLGLVALYREDYAAAASFYAEAQDVFQEDGYDVGVVSCLLYRGIAASYQGHLAQAAELVEASLPGLRQAGDTVAIMRALCCLGMVALRQGDWHKAGDRFKASLALAWEKGARDEIAQCLEGLGGTTAASGTPEKAAYLFSAAKRLREEIGSPLPPGAGADCERQIADLRARLEDPDSFVRAWAEGQDTPLRQIVEDLLQQG